MPTTDLKGDRARYTYCYIQEKTTLSALVPCRTGFDDNEIFLVYEREVKVNGRYLGSPRFCDRKVQNEFFMVKFRTDLHSLNCLMELVNSWNVNVPTRDDNDGRNSANDIDSQWKILLCRKVFLIYTYSPVYHD